MHEPVFPDLSHPEDEEDDELDLDWEDLVERYRNKHDARKGSSSAPTGKTDEAPNVVESPFSLWKAVASSGSSGQQTPATATSKDGGWSIPVNSL